MYFFPINPFDFCGPHCVTRRLARFESAERNFPNFWLPAIAGNVIFVQSIFSPVLWIWRTTVDPSTPKINEFCQCLPNMCLHYRPCGGRTHVYLLYLYSFACLSLKKKKKDSRGHEYYIILCFSCFTETAYTVWAWTIWKRSRSLDGRLTTTAWNSALWKAKARKIVTTTSKYSCPPESKCLCAVLEHFHLNARGERSVTYIVQ